MCGITKDVRKCEILKSSKDAILRLCAGDPPLIVNRKTRDFIVLSNDLGTAIAVLLKGSTLDDIAKILDLNDDERKALIEALKYLAIQGWIEFEFH